MASWRFNMFEPRNKSRSPVYRLFCSEAFSAATWKLIQMVIYLQLTTGDLMKSISIMCYEKVRIMTAPMETSTIKKHLKLPKRARCRQ